MGMFDTVTFTCPTSLCKTEIHVQSKAGQCLLDNYSSFSVPVEIANDIFGDIAYCPACKLSFKVVGPKTQHTVSVFLEPLR